MAEEHKKSFMLYFDNFPCVAALDAEQRGELLLLLYRYAMAADKAPTDPEEVLRQHPGLREETRMAYQEAAARRQGDGAISRQALEQAAPKDYSDIRKYLRDVSTAGRLPKSDP